MSIIRHWLLHAVVRQRIALCGFSHNSIRFVLPGIRSFALPVILVYRFTPQYQVPFQFEFSFSTLRVYISSLNFTRRSIDLRLRAYGLTVRTDVSASWISLSSAGTSSSACSSLISRRLLGIVSAQTVVLISSAGFLAHEKEGFKSVYIFA